MRAGTSDSTVLFMSTQVSDYFMERHTRRKTLNFKPVLWFSGISNKTRNRMKVMVKSAFNGSDATVSWCTFLRDGGPGSQSRPMGYFPSWHLNATFFLFLFSSVLHYYHLAVHQHIIRMENKLSWLKKEKQCCCKEHHRINPKRRPLWMGLLTRTYMLSSFWEFPLPVHQKYSEEALVLASS